MTLDWRICSRARLSRDPRFDGKFFIGVIGSHVYCRSICPAPTAQEKNCRYFPTAAAAAEAGFRPCLRCRPECSPGTPAWLGTPITVARALRLISESGLTDGGVETLAEQTWRWLPSSSAAFPQAPGCDAQCRGPDPASSFRQEAHR